MQQQVKCDTTVLNIFLFSKDDLIFLKSQADVAADKDQFKVHSCSLQVQCILTNKTS